MHATEIGYGYKGDEYWDTFAQETPSWDDSDRQWVKTCFVRFSPDIGREGPAAVAHTLVMPDQERNLEFDLQAIASRMRTDRAFATDVYFALANTEWRHDDGTQWSGSMRYVSGLVATLRGRGEDYMDFYCAPGGREGTVSEPVASAMAELGWHVTPTGVPVE